MLRKKLVNSQFDIVLIGYCTMYKYILESVENINWLAAGTLVFFFLVFVGTTIWIMTRKKEFLDKMSNMPLEDED